MSAQRVEIEHNSLEQVGEYLAAALGIMERHALEVRDHPALLVKLLELIASKTVQVVQMAPQPALLPMPSNAVPPPFQGRR